MIDDMAGRGKTTQPEGDLPERRRTVLVWVIFAYAFFALLSTIVSFGMWLLGVQPFASTVMRLGPTYCVISLVSLVLFFAGCLALFNLRAKAVVFLSINLVVYVVGGIYALLVVRLEDYPPPPGTQDLAVWQWGMRAATLGGIVMGLAIYGAILAYAVRLRRRGILM
jgi:hypothetical protein